MFRATIVGANAGGGSQVFQIKDSTGHVLPGTMGRCYSVPQGIKYCGSGQPERPLQILRGTQSGADLQGQHTLRRRPLSDNGVNGAEARGDRRQLQGDPGPVLVQTLNSPSLLQINDITC